MDIVLALFILGLLFIIPRKNMGGKLQQQVSKHGHRCYLDTNLTRGELEVVHLLASKLSAKEYFLFNNLIVPSEVLGTTQIDHVVVSRYGIFVIENKDLNGWVYANDNHKKWTQTLNRRSKYTFQNPLIQNFAHISALKEQLPFIKNQMFNVVVFSPRAQFKTEKPEGVMYPWELTDFILSKNEPILKEVELLVVIGKLSMLCQSVEITSEQHAVNTQNRIASAQPVSATR